MNKTILLALLSAGVLICSVQAESKPNVSKDPVSGRISFLGKEGEKITVKTKGGGESVGFKVAADTKVSINGETKTMAELKKDWKVTVTPKAEDPATAASIEVSKGGKKEDKADAKE